MTLITSLSLISDTMRDLYQLLSLHYVDIFFFPTGERHLRIWRIFVRQPSFLMWCKWIWMLYCFFFFSSLSEIVHLWRRKQGSENNSSVLPFSMLLESKGMRWKPQCSDLPVQPNPHNIHHAALWHCWKHNALFEEFWAITAWRG